jgi:hypothetical protein
LRYDQLIIAPLAFRSGGRCGSGKTLCSQVTEAQEPYLKGMDGRKLITRAQSSFADPDALALAVKDIFSDWVTLACIWQKLSAVLELVKCYFA